MEELLKSSGYKMRGFRRGETIKGKIVEVSGKVVTVDINGKAGAIISEKEYVLNREYFKSLKPGDEVTGMVLVSENENGQVVLSLRRAAVDQKWKAFEEAMAEETKLMVRGKELTKGGMLVETEGIFGFVPSSQFSREMETNTGAYIGKAFPAKVIEVDRSMNRLVLSERAVSESDEIEKRKKLLGSVKVGGEYEGVIVGMVPFGVFVAVNINKGNKTDPVEGLVHISEISWEKVDDVNKVLKAGDKVKVQVIGIDEENGKLALSMKRLSGDPWATAAAKYPVNSQHKGLVTKLVPYGVLVKMEKGIEGLIHASKMPADKTFAEGEEVNVFVESVDLDKRRLSLGVVLSEKPVDYK